MKCSDLSADSARCRRGIPVARLFRHYFCEGDHHRCPLKRYEKNHRGVRRGRRFSRPVLVESGS